MARAKKLPSGSWRVRVCAGKSEGRYIYKSFTAPTRKEAEYAAAQYLAGEREKARPGAMTVGEAIDRYIDARSAVLSPSTICAYRKIRKNNLSSIMRVRLDQLSPEDVQKAVNVEAMAHSPKTVRNQYALLTAALAVYAPGFAPAAHLPQKTRTEIEIPDAAAMRAILDDVRETRMELPVLLAAAMGLRRSEICALTPADYDGHTLTISKAAVLGDDGAIHIKAPKSYAGARVLAVPDVVAEALQRHPLPVGMTPAAITDSFERTCRRVGVRVRFHALRHYYASSLLALGVPDKYAMQRMGHATPHMLKAVYQHVQPDKQKSLDAAINAAICHDLCHDGQDAQ